ncbi:hypothetical protein GGR52DRAFT_538191, partial [Hypoxylon sp. FL1284]
MAVANVIATTRTVLAPSSLATTALTSIVGMYMCTYIRHALKSCRHALHTSKLIFRSFLVGLPLPTAQAGWSSAYHRRKPV